MTSDVLGVRDVLDQDQLDSLNFLTVAQHVKRPDGLPDTELEFEVEIAERLLEYAISQEGHHTGIQHSMEDWASDHRNSDANPGYWRRMAFALTPSERNFGRIEGDEETKRKKAETIRAWASDCYGEGVVEEIESELRAEARERWEDKIEEAHKRAEVQRFAKSPPDEYHGWEQIDTEHDHVEVAYQKQDKSGDIAAVYTAEDGSLDAGEYTAEQWGEAGGDPHETDYANRPVVLVSNGQTVWKDFRSHLKKFGD